VINFFFFFADSPRATFPPLPRPSNLPGVGNPWLFLARRGRTADLQDALRLLHFHKLPYFSSTYSGEIISTFFSITSRQD
jgi:hypothetical protein